MGLRVETVISGASGAPFFSRMNFVYDGTGDPALAATNAAAAVADFWIAAGVVLSESLQWQVQQDVISYNEATGQPTASYPQGGQFGTFAAASEPLPWATQGLVQWFTGVYVGGRQIRGRTFVPGATEPSNVAGRPGGSFPTTLQAAAQALVDDADSTLGVYSKGSTRPVTGTSVWAKWAVLTSRRD